jgi:hypothetical protein
MRKSSHVLIKEGLAKIRSERTATEFKIARVLGWEADLRDIEAIEAVGDLAGFEGVFQAPELIEGTHPKSLTVTPKTETAIESPFGGDKVDILVLTNGCHRRSRRRRQHHDDVAAEPPCQRLYLRLRCVESPREGE